MSGKLTRRELLKDFGAIGVAGSVTGTSLLGSVPTEDPTADMGAQSRRTNHESLVEITAGKMKIVFDNRLGILYSITQEGDPLATNFLGNSDNTDGIRAGDTHWTGDVVTTLWELTTSDWVREMPTMPGVPMRRSGQWRNESTLNSDDIRKISFDGKSLKVKYAGRSKNESGIRSFTLEMSYLASPENALIWHITITNITERTLEIGELAFPLRVNDDYGAPYHGMTATQAIVQGKMPPIQKEIYEQKVFAHPFIAGHSSYVLVQRPNGDIPFLLFHCTGDASLECHYKVEGHFRGAWIGTDLLAIHSWATHDRRGWAWNPWINGHSSLVLEPGEKKTFQFRFVFIKDYDAIRVELFSAGNLGIRILPSMVVPEETDVYLDVRCQRDLDQIEIHSDGVSVKQRKRTGDHTLLTFSFKGRGQKTVKLLYAGGRWTNLHFYCTEDFEQLVKARARFIAERQYYENPADPFHRNHMFLPFDYRRGTAFDENDDVWEVGGTDDPGFGEPLFLAEKNVNFPNPDEIAKLETYISDCLFKYIQNPETYEVRASLYWKKRYPSSPWGSWDEKRSETTWRNYNYAFVANIYHAMYRVGRAYPLLKQRAARDYLNLSYRTALKWFNQGPYRHMGLITGSNIANILDDLKREGLQREHETLLNLVKECKEEFVRNPYPYASEIEIDETGQHQVYFLTKYFAASGDEESRVKNRKVLMVLKAMRGGDQPVWFYYGSDFFAHPDLRGELTCWHSGALNGMALLDGFEATGDRQMLVKGYAGLVTVMHNVLADGMGYAWFILKPGVFSCEPPKTFESGPGLWGFVRSAKSYVIHDDLFGPVGFGCRVESSPGMVKVYPRDGVRKRLRLVEEKIDIETATGEIKLVTFKRDDGSLEIQTGDSTGIVKTVNLTVRGLAKGEYNVACATAKRRVTVTNTLELSLPSEEAGAITIEKI
jgi:hypothetical protein